MIEITNAGYEIALISFGIVFLSSLVRRIVLDQEKLKESKEKIKEHQQVMRDASKTGDMKKMQKAQETMMELSMEQLRESFKPMIFTLIPIMLIFGWIRDQYGAIENVVTIFGHGFGWLGWYMLCAILISISINKLLEKL